MADYAPPLNNPWFQAFDSSGAPLSGGKVKTYEAGSSTPKITWQDGGKDSANANPVILNSYGMAKIFGEGLYKIELYDSDDNLIDTIDYVLALKTTDDARDFLAQASATAQRSSLGLGTSATKDAGTDGGDVLLLADDAKLPALDGSDLTNLGSSAASVPPQHLSGLILSYSLVTTFGVSAGKCRDSTDSTTMSLATAYTKTLSGWAVGTGNGSLQSGLSLLPSTWYHAHAIYNPESSLTDIMISTSPTGPTLPPGYTTFRRLGSILTTGGSQITDFSQKTNQFLWKDPPLDIEATGVGTTAANRTLTVPLGIKVQAIMNVTFANPDGASSLYLSSPDVDDEAAVGSGAGPLATVVADTTNSKRFSGGVVTIRTNTSRQIRSRASLANSSLDISVLGWLDDRGVGS